MANGLNVSLVLLLCSIQTDEFYICPTAVRDVRQVTGVMRPAARRKQGCMVEPGC